MKKISLCLLGAAATALCLLGVALLNSGCATQTQGTGTNAVTVVNPINLAIDEALVQGSAAAAVTITLQNDPQALIPLQDALTALDGVINGANTNSVSQIIFAAGLKNAVLAEQITPVVITISGLEQGLIQKYGATVGGQVALGLAKALDGGITAGITAGRVKGL